MKLSELYTIFCTITWDKDEMRDKSKDKEAIFLEKWTNPTKKTDEQIADHFKKKNAAIAIATGKSNGFTVIDFDTKNNELMMELYEKAPTYCVETKKGFHFYYKYNQIPEQGTDRYGVGVDVRNDGGLIFAPPTPNYKRFGDNRISELTDEALSILKKNETAPIQKSLASTQTRNDALFRKMCGWLKHYPEQEAWNRTVKANRDFLKGELSDKELETMFQSAKRYPAQENKEKIAEQISKVEEYDGVLSIDKKEKRYTWGTHDLNHNIVILKRGNLVVLGAKRNMGKTTFSFDMATKNAKLGHRVLYISLEMREEEILEALARKYAGIDIPEEYDYKIPEEKRIKMIAKINEIKSMQNFKFSGVRRAEGIVWETVKELMEKNPADICFIDNLDCISGNASEDNNERQKRIVSSLMNYTVEKNIPVVLIHHYRKGQNKSSGMDELAGSGKVADAADIIINLSRKSLEENIAENIQYPETNKTFLWVQKGRGYDDKMMEIYYINGTFCDGRDIYKKDIMDEALSIFGGKIVD